MGLINHHLINLVKSSLCINDFSRQSGLGTGNEQWAVNSLRLHLYVYMWLWLCVWKV